MLITPHLLTGAVIGTAVANLPLAIILSLVSHYALDFLPHCDQGTLELPEKKKYGWAVVDFGIGLIILIYLTSLDRLGLTAWIAAGAAIFPDLTDNLPIVSDYLPKYWPFNRLYPFHERLQDFWREQHLSLGILTQVIIIGLSLWFLLK